MRLAFLFILFFAFSYTNAQVTISAAGGINSTTVQLPSNVYWVNTKARMGWQGGLHLTSAGKHWMVYSGIGVSKLSFNAANGFYSSVVKAPLFIHLPAGAGYSLPFARNLALRLYTGLYSNLGIGGNFTGKLYGNCGIVACPENGPTVYTGKRALHYGHTTGATYSDDLYKANWGLQFGAGLHAFKRFELACMYNLGLNYITPYYMDDQKQKLRSFEISVTYNLVTFRRL